MKCVDVLINLPDTRFDSLYTYFIPEGYSIMQVLGRRVLVELGRKKVEGYAVKESTLSSKIMTDLKPIIKVLDKEPVFDEELFRLAEWMSENYICPLSMALNIIVPRAITRKKDEVVIPNVCADEVFDLELNQFIEKYTVFFEQLWKKGEISLREAKKILGSDVLEQLKFKGLVSTTGTYSGYSAAKAGYIYKIDKFDFDRDMPYLCRKAPRQAEALEFLLSEGEAECEVFDKIIPKASINALLNKGYIKKVRKKPEFTYMRPVLTDEQKLAIESIVEDLGKGYKEYLLFGVTGSGKSEVYLNAAEFCIKKGKSVIILVPEIALTRHLVEMFSLRIPDIAVMHSGMTLSERYDEWQRIKRGEARLVLGTRSAVFAPVHNLGLIIIDEEQENTYKQEETPRYHAVEVARKRAQIESALLVLGSATPSIETFYRAMQGEMKLLALSKRVGEAVMPRVYIEDMRLNKGSAKTHNLVISGFLYKKIQENLDKGEQSILFLNRRGYSLLTICAQCGNVILCPNCSVGMTYHNDIKLNICHYCNFSAKPPVFCPECGSKYLKQVGFGTQRVEEELKRLFPEAKIKRLDIDISRRREEQKNILKAMQNKEIDILIGTQMIAKGFNFPAVSLVGIIDADGMLNLPDFRAGERAFQLIVQAAGRAGRGGIPGEVVIQTYQPDNHIVNLAARQDYIGFYYEEIKQRKLLDYPPFTNILRMVASSLNQNVCEEEAQNLVQYINEIIDAKEDRLEILGPAPCPIMRLRNRFRYQVIIKCENILLLRSIGRHVVKNRIKFSSDVRIEVDINPLVLM
ncbi:primosomal protein N' [Thermosyntropha sp.]|uniref:replication restart helicase PriA n=1 Tax=Thermosyntropha sp. TaxID=2740820 RepID=UPI0025D38236|nr:primosomal protein N' [Thermosyntropha sp.]MBO8158520.1 primosomal protein N' [Thermosyntropha sp.]